MKNEVSTENETELMRAFNDGKKEAFEKIFDEFYKSICYFTQKLVLNREESEDISITVFQELFKRCKGFTTRSNIKAFLYISARNACLNSLHNDKQMGKYLGKRVIISEDWQNDYLNELNTGDPLRQVLKNELMAEIASLIKKLPPQRQKIFKKRYLEDKTVSEIARELDLTPGTVSYQIRLALESIRAQILLHLLLLILIQHKFPG